MMLSSRTLGERNNDPYPHVLYPSFIFPTEARYSTPTSGSTLNPRPEFQHGKLPANPALVWFRTMSSDESIERRTSRAYAFLASLHDVEKTSAINSFERIHAHRVLTLLATLEVE